MRHTAHVTLKLYIPVYIQIFQAYSVIFYFVILYQVGYATDI